jgi:hypothetical protein
MVMRRGGGNDVYFAFFGDLVFFRLDGFVYYRYNLVRRYLIAVVSGDAL